MFAHIYPAVGRVGARPLPKSKIAPFDQGLVDPRYIPAKLDVNAFFEWVVKSTKPKGEHRTDAEIFRCLDLLRMEFGPYTQYGLSTLDEVLDDVDMSKSPGLPYVNLGCSTKAEAWARYRDEILDSVNKLLSGIYVESDFIATPKDELVKPDKSARIFCPSSFHHQLACAILFKKMVDSWTTTEGKHSSAVGVDLFRQGLNQHLERLSEFPDGYDFDHTAFDLTARNNEVARDFCKLGLPRCWWPAVDLLWSLAICPRLQVDNVIIQMMMNPSGWYLTTFLNTLNNFINCYEAFSALLTAHGFEHSNSDLFNYFKTLHGGDDGALSTRWDEFNFVEFAEWLRIHRGVVLTADTLEPRDPMELTFFSHTLIKRRVDFLDREILVPAGRLDKLLAAFSYVKKKDGKINYLNSAQRVNGLLCNLWAFKEVFESVYPYAVHLLTHFFLQSGANLTPEWRGVFSSIPTDASMYELWQVSKHEGYFFPSADGYACNNDFRFKRNPHRKMQAAAISAAAPIVAAVGKKIANKIRGKGNRRKKNSPRYKKKSVARPTKNVRRLVPKRNSPGGVVYETPKEMVVVPNRAFHVQKPGSRVVHQKTKFGTVTSKTVNTTEAKGRIFLGTLATPNLATQYVDLYSNTLNPLAYTNTRLFQLARLFQKFRFNEIRLEFCPEVGTNTGGSIQMYCTDDPELRFPVGPGQIGYFTQLDQIAGSTRAPVWMPNTMVKKFKNDPAEEYYIQLDDDNEERFTSQGYFGLTPSFTPSINVTYGTLSMYYDISLWEPATVISTLDSWTQIVSTTNGTIALRPYVEDSGNGPGQGVRFNNGTVSNGVPGMTVGTVYVIMMNFSCGGIKSMAPYFVKTPAAGAWGCFYSNYSDAAASADNTNSTGYITASYSSITRDYPPAVNSIWFTLSGVIAPPSTTLESVTRKVVQSLDQACEALDHADLPEEQRSELVRLLVDDIDLRRLRLDCNFKQSDDNQARLSELQSELEHVSTMLEVKTKMLDQATSIIKNEYRRRDSDTPRLPL